jgi:hypothetical protein
MHCSQRFCHFLNASWRQCSVRAFSTTCDSASITSIVLKLWPFNAETEKSRWGPSQASMEGGGATVVLFLVKRFLVQRGVWDGVFSWHQFFCLSSFSCSHHKMSQQYTELTVWPDRTNSLWIIRSMSKKMMNMLSTLLSNCLAFSRHASLSECLCNHCQGLCCTSSEICTKYDAHSLFLCRIHHRITSGQIHDSKQKDVKKLAHPPSYMKFCILTPKICLYYYLPFHRTTTTAVQMPAPVLEIMHTTSSDFQLLRSDLYIPL